MRRIKRALINCSLPKGAEVLCDGHCGGCPWAEWEVYNDTNIYDNSAKGKNEQESNKSDA